MNSTPDTQELDAEIFRLKQEIIADADKVAGIRRHRRIRTIISATGGGILFGVPTFSVYSDAGLFATLVGAFIGFSAMQLYFLAIPSQFANSSAVRRHRRAEEELARHIDERRGRIKKANAAYAVDAASASDSDQEPDRSAIRVRPRH